MMSYTVQTTKTHVAPVVGAYKSSPEEAQPFLLPLMIAVSPAVGI